MRFFVCLWLHSCLKMFFYGKLSSFVLLFSSDICFWISWFSFLKILDLITQINCFLQKISADNWFCCQIWKRSRHYMEGNARNNSPNIPGSSTEVAKLAACPSGFIVSSFILIADGVIIQTYSLPKRESLNSLKNIDKENKSLLKCDKKH